MVYNMQTQLRIRVPSGLSAQNRTLKCRAWRPDWGACLESRHKFRRFVGTMSGARMSPSLVLLTVSLVTVTLSAADAHPGTIVNRLLKVQKIFWKGKGTALKTIMLDSKQTREIAKLLGKGATVVPSGCQCSSKSETCGCCASINLPRIKLSSKVCANMSYDASKSGIAFTLTWNDKVIFHKIISVLTPPALCVPVPVSHLAKLCVVFYGLGWKNKTLTGCARIRVTILNKDIDFFDLGCFSFGPFGQHLYEDVSAAFPHTLAEMREGQVPGQNMAEVEEGDDVEEDSQPAPNGCQCLWPSKTCSCCTTINIPKTKLALDLCANISYDPYPAGVLFTLTVGGRVIFRQIITVKDHEDYCVGVPGVPTGKLCIQLYGFNWTDVMVKGCLRASLALMGREVARVNLGCFSLGPFNQTVNQDISAEGLKLLAAMVAVGTAVSRTEDGWKTEPAVHGNSVLTWRPSASLGAASRLMQLVRRVGSPGTL